MALRLTTTDDGSHTLLNTALSETYHSRRGALTESLHVFIHEGLAWMGARMKEQPLRVFEMGFGTGLNAFLALRHAINHRVAVDYHGIDTQPLDHAIVHALNYARVSAWPEGEAYFHQLHSAEWGKKTAIIPEFTFLKSRCSIEQCEPGTGIHVVFYDAFAPSKQASVWDLEILKRLHGSMEQEAILVTYCASGQFKRNLATAGFEVQSLPGPPGKREMVRALKPLIIP